MNAKIVAIPLFAAIWLGSPAKALAQDPDPAVLSKPRIAVPRSSDTPTQANDDRRGRGRQGSGGGNRGGGGRSGPDGRGNRGDRGGGSADSGRSPSPRAAIVPRGPSTNYGSSYRRPYYPPSYYDRWAYQTYRWSPLSYVPWSWIYGTAGYANFGYSYGGGYGNGYGSVYPSYGPGGYGMYPPYGRNTTYDTGELRLRIHPRDAQVFVDGYFAGVVDDFDGTFQSLRLEQGGHKIEVRMPGFETLEVDVHIQPNRTMTLREELRPKP